MKLEKVNLHNKLNLISDYWNPRIVGALNGQHVKLAKLHGEFVWHKHEDEDELFLVIDGCLKIELRNDVIELREGDFFIVPKGLEHKPVAEKEVSVLLFEPASTLNTGDVDNERTRKNLESI